MSDSVAKTKRVIARYLAQAGLGSRGTGTKPLGIGSWNAAVGFLGLPGISLPLAADVGGHPSLAKQARFT